MAQDVKDLVSLHHYNIGFMPCLVSLIYVASWWHWATRTLSNSW